MKKESINYKCDDLTLRGYLCHPREIQGKRPGIIVSHAWYGLDDFAKQKAEELARLGYIAFVADVYGNERPIKNNEEALHFMGPLFIDRALLVKRISAGFRLLQHHPLVDTKHLGAIGFCFGGLTTLELFRSGAELQGAVMFHGLLGDRMGEHEAKTVPIASNIKGSLLILHGHDDPLVSTEDIAITQERLTKAKIDWQMHVYGQAAHAFTNPEAHDINSGLIYNEKADRRSWQLMSQFFAETFQFNE